MALGMNGPNERHLQFPIIEVAGRLETFQASRTTSFGEDMGEGNPGQIQDTIQDRKKPEAVHGPVLMSHRVDSSNQVDPSSTPVDVTIILQ